jgi:trimeric autotransporter adhesin
MRKWLCVFLWLAVILGLAWATRAPGAELITSSITLTNYPTNGATIIVQGSTRTWTNDISSSPGTLIQQTNSAPQSATNLINHLTRYPAAVGHYLAMGNPTNVTIRGTVGEVMTVTASAGWAVITYSTQTVTTAYVVREPHTVEPANQQTNIASLLMKHLSLSTNGADNFRITNAVGIHGTANKVTGGWFTNSAIDKPNITNGVANGLQPTNVIALHGTNYLLSGGTYADYVGTNATLTNIAWLNGTVGGRLTGGIYDGGLLTNIIRFDGTIGRATNGYFTNMVADDPIFTNVTVYHGLSSLSTNAAGTVITTSFRAGDGARATNDLSLAIGVNALAGGYSSVALGNLSQSLTQYCVAVGDSSLVDADGAVGVGQTARARGFRSVALGYTSLVRQNHDYSVALGANSQTETNGQIMLGSADVSWVRAFGRIQAGSLTNNTFTGTNINRGEWADSTVTVTSLANGNNIAVAGSNAVVRLAAGPTAGFTICGFQGGYDGRRLTVWNDTGQVITLANQSGVDPTAANRIITTTGADVVGGTNTCYTLRYFGDRSRWVIEGKSN